MTTNHAPPKFMTHDEAAALFGQHFEAQCGRCGSSLDRVDCHDCGSDGYVTMEDDEGNDETETCTVCDGDGGWMNCLSSFEWCEANPLEGREQVKRSTIEWFPTDGPDV